MVSMAAGAAAGLTVDLSLYPIDTLKTRLQAPEGFSKSGGFSHIYRGLPITLIGSAPASAIFFTAFESAQRPINECFDFAERRVRKICWNQTDDFELTSPESPFRHMAVNAVAAAWAESLASFIRTPVESMKQQCQTLSPDHKHAGQCGRRTALALASSTPFISLWAGWGATLSRDIPFAIIQYPLYHATKRYVNSVLHNDKELKEPLAPMPAAFCGSFTAGIAAAMTTPFDVAQTHVMLLRSRQVIGGHYEKLTTRGALRQIYAKDGVRGLWKGVVPRVAWMSIGGLIFLGSYEQVKVLLTAENETRTQQYQYAFCSDGDDDPSDDLDASGNGRQRK